MNDLNSQMNRLDMMNLSGDRRKRVQDAFTRYARNIRQTEDYRNDERAYERAYIQGKRSVMSMVRFQKNNRKYSRSTYMGLSKG